MAIRCYWLELSRRFNLVLCGPTGHQFDDDLEAVVGWLMDEVGDVTPSASVAEAWLWSHLVASGSSVSGLEVVADEPLRDAQVLHVASQIDSVCKVIRVAEVSRP